MLIIDKDLQLALRLTWEEALRVGNEIAMAVIAGAERNKLGKEAN